MATVTASGTVMTSVSESVNPSNNVTSPSNSSVGAIVATVILLLLFIPAITATSIIVIVIFVRRRKRKLESPNVAMATLDTGNSLPCKAREHMDTLDNPLYSGKTDDQAALTILIADDIHTNDTKHAYEMEESGAYAQLDEPNYSEPEALQYVSP